ncbi:MAG TPA: transglycosylase SLT domain-containing protein [Methylococcaceae bacterium]|nr:transglycosylase SLT domain-containing protein [Methylococcaceae bacterium]
MKTGRVVGFFSCVFCVLFLAAPARADFSSDTARALYRQADAALNKGRLKEADALLEKLGDYPLYPNLRSRRLSLTPGEFDAIESFLDRQAGTRQAKRLRADWLPWLAERGEWARLAARWREDEDGALRCHYLRALQQLGRSEEAFAGGETLWLSGKTQPPACESLFQAMRDAGRLSGEKIWQRFAAALGNRQSQLAQSLVGWLPEAERPAASLWLKIHDQPILAEACAGWPEDGRVAGRIFLHGLDRMASDDPLRAKALWQARRARFAVDAADAARIERRLALALALARRAEALPALQSVPPEWDDEETRVWRVRAALLNDDWRAVLQGIERLAEPEKNQPEWRYWRARALEQGGEREAAVEGFRRVAIERDLFGFLAADRLGQSYELAHRPSLIEASELERLAQTPPFRRVAEFRALGEMDEARAEWMYAVKSLSPRDLVVAATLAQRWDWNTLAIFTVARAGEWDDLDLRYPLLFENTVVREAARQRVEPGVILGVIRQESAFDALAQSAAGARGLMQILPSTGQDIARSFGERLFSAARLHDAETNLRYGTHFLRDLLDRFEGNLALAAAAYNAGATRVRRWAPSGRPLAADVWMEQIPYRETRHYVMTVLGNAVIYQQRRGQNGDWRLSRFLPDVPARPAEGADSPPVPDCP